MFGGPFEPPVIQPVPQPGLGVDPGFGRGIVNDVVGPQPFGVVRDSFWPKSAISWLVLSVVLLFASVQLVSPTRRWNPRLPGFLRRPSRRISA
jgi:hypothetical protein